MDDVFHDGLPDALSAAADPDLALLGLVRVLEALPEDESAGLLLALRRAGPPRDRLVAVLGGSVALVDHLVRHPTTGGAWPKRNHRPPEACGRAW
jgi:glutamate-ammonia-ligase adenylyltransferase